MILQANSVRLTRASRHLVDQVSLDVHKGELVGLIGPNGAGKSTLLNLLAGLEACDAGDVRLDGEDITAMGGVRRGRLLAWVAQSGPVNWPLTVERIITLGRRPHMGPWQRLTDDDQRAIEAAIAATDCESLRLQDATTLSGGERTRMLLARALAAQPRLLLADEPVAALDLKHQLQTMTVLREFARDDRACLVVLHDLSLAARYCDRLYLMHEGQVVAEGVPSIVLNAKNLREVYGVEVEFGDGDIPSIVPVREV